MNKYLEVDCQQLEIKEEGGEILIKVKAKIRADPLQKHRNTVQMIHPELLKEKEALYAEMFKSKVVIPKPPQPEKVEEPVNEQKAKEEDKNQHQKKSIFSSSSGENNQESRNPRNIFGDDTGTSSNKPLFGRRWNGDNNQRVPERSDPQWRNSNVFSSNFSRDDRNNPPNRPTHPFSSGSGGRLMERDMGGGGSGGRSYDSGRNQGNMGSQGNQGNMARGNVFLSSGPSNPTPSLFGDLNQDQSNTSSRQPSRGVTGRAGRNNNSKQRIC